MLADKDSSSFIANKNLDNSMRALARVIPQSVKSSISIRKQQFGVGHLLGQTSQGQILNQQQLHLLHSSILKNQQISLTERHFKHDNNSGVGTDRINAPGESFINQTQIEGISSNISQQDYSQYPTYTGTTPYHDRRSSFEQADIQKQIRRH